MSAYLLAAAITAHLILEGRGLALLRSPSIWIATLAMHVALWRAAAWFKNRPYGSNWMWIIALVPAPIFLLSVIAASRSLAKLVGHTAFQMGILVSTSWIVLVLAGVVVFRAAYRGWEDWDYVADIAEIASWTGIGILPFTGVIQWAEVLLNYD